MRTTEHIRMDGAALTVTLKDTNLYIARLRIEAWFLKIEIVYFRTIKLLEMSQTRTSVLFSDLA